LYPSVRSGLHIGFDAESRLAPFRCPAARRLPAAIPQQRGRAVKTPIRSLFGPDPDSENLGQGPAALIQALDRHLIMHPASAFQASDQTGLLKDTEVLGDSRLGHAQPLSDGVDALGMFLEQPDDLEPGLGGKRLEHLNLVLHPISFQTRDGKLVY